MLRRPNQPDDVKKIADEYAAARANIARARADLRRAEAAHDAGMRALEGCQKDFERVARAFKAAIEREISEGPAEPARAQQKKPRGKKKPPRAPKPPPTAEAGAVKTGRSAPRESPGVRVGRLLEAIKEHAADWDYIAEKIYGEPATPAFVRKAKMLADYLVKTGRLKRVGKRQYEVIS